MQFLNKLFIVLSSTEIGKDEFGNQYYQSKRKNYLGMPKRYVVYNGKAEPSKVSVKWHAWLHYLEEEIPVNSEFLTYNKQYVDNNEITDSVHKNHLINTRLNLTGTKYSYDPTAYTKKEKIIPYKVWQPKV